MSKNPSDPRDSAAHKARERRLAQALRANLRLRKAQARGVEEDGVTVPNVACDEPAGSDSKR